MIEIIKKGKKKFTAVCSHCGCEFAYELEDIFGGFVTCPCCSHSVYHNDQNPKVSKSINWPPNPADPIPCDIKIPNTVYIGGQRVNINGSRNPCEGCPTYERIQKGETVIGDQCYWCPNSPTRVTCTSNSIEPETYMD